MIGLRVPWAADAHFYGYNEENRTRLGAEREELA